MKKFLVLLLVLCMVCPLALADELRFKNLTPER